LERRLAAILAADVVGYSRLMGQDEARTLERLKSLRRELVQPKIAARKGRIVKLMGDGLLAEFPSVVEAVRCALEIQRATMDREADLPNSERLQLRIGVNLGDIIIEGNDIYGDGVNIAARLEGLADPGGICISGPAFDTVEGKLDAHFEDIGHRQVKNIARPVRVYQLNAARSRVDTRPRSPATPLLPDQPSIAVLPFTNLSGNSERDYISDGIAEDIIAGLSHFRSLFVIARSSSFSYKGKAVDKSAIAQDLAVRYLLEGSLRQSGDRVRIGAQLVEAGTGKQLWAERYDRQMQDFFAVQDAITEAILAALLPEIGAAEAERAKRARPEELDTWALYHRALDHLFRYSRRDNREARALFRKAIDKDPNFAASYAGLAYACFLAVHDDYTDRVEHCIAEGLEAAHRAVTLDPRDALGHAAFGRILTLRKEFERAIAACDTAIDLNPSLAPAYFGRGYALTMIGRGEPALADLCRAIELSPRDPNVWAFMCVNAWAHSLCDRHQDAMDWALRSARHTNTNFWAPVTLALCHAKLGRQDEARRMLSDALDLKPDLTFAYIGRTLPFEDAAVTDRLFGILRPLGLPDTGDATPPKRTLPLPDKPSIAVLPFENISGEPAQEPFADGLTEEVITTLSKISKLFVIARNSTLVYKGRAVDIRQVGRELGVQYVLEGSVRGGGGGQVRVTAQLIEAATGRHLWAQRYDRESGDVFVLQDDVTKEIVSALQVELTEGEQARLAARGTRNAEAWQLTFEGRDLVHAHHKDSVQKGRRLLEQAIALDEFYALAWDALAEAHWKEARHKGWSASSERSLELAVEATDRALALEPDNAGFLAMRSLLMTSLRKFDEALALAETAVRTAHSEANAIAIAGLTLGACGKAEMAIQQTRLAMRYCPRYPPWYLVSLAYCNWILEREDEAIAACRAAIAADPDVDLPHIVLAMVHAEAGREADARQAAEAVLRIDPDFSAQTYMRGLPYRDPALAERRRAALQKAGLPD
jgi:adenylate cyclase